MSYLPVDDPHLSEDILLRKEFYQERKNIKVKDGQIRRIFVSFGGANSNEIMKVINAIKRLDQNKINVDLLLTDSTKNHLKIKNLLSKFTNVTIHDQNSQYSETAKKIY